MLLLTSLLFSAAWISRGLSFHSNAVFSFGLFLRAGGRSQGAKKQKMQSKACHDHIPGGHSVPSSALQDQHPACEEPSVLGFTWYPANQFPSRGFYMLSVYLKQHYEKDFLFSFPSSEKSSHNSGNIAFSLHS